MSASRPLRTRPGFSLPELLVCIGVVAILVGVLLPVLGSARRSAQKAVCLAQLGDHTKVLFAFATDTKGQWPDASAWAVEMAERSSAHFGEPMPEVDGGFRASLGALMWPVPVLDAYDHNPFHRSLRCPANAAETDQEARWAEEALGKDRSEIVGLHSYRMSAAMLLDPQSLIPSLDPETVPVLVYAAQRVDRVRYPSLKACLFDRGPYHDPGQTRWPMVFPPYLLNVSAADGSARELDTADATPGVPPRADASPGFGQRPPNDPGAAEARRRLDMEASKLDRTPHGVLGMDWN